MKIETREVYIGDDGEVYSSPEEAAIADKKFFEDKKNTTYWTYHHGADTTEGRGLFSRTNVKIKNTSYVDSKVLLEDWCFRVIGRPITFVQGCSPMVAWKISPSSADEWNSNSKNYCFETNVDVKRIQLVFVTGEGLIKA